MDLTPCETQLVGTWREVNGVVTADAICARIEALTSTVLELLATADGGWSKLFRDPSDGRLWGLTYPNSEWHGAGPPCLTCIGREQAVEKYGEVAG